MRFVDGGPTGKNGGVTTEAAQLFSAMLALLTLIAGVLSFAALLVRDRFAWSRALNDTVADLGPILICLVSFGAMAGSLYFSEVANFNPCKLCWYQRIAVYSTAIISLVGVVRRLRTFAPYTLVLSIVGLVVSIYHNVLEWFPTLESSVCSIDVPCTTIWFREFGFVTLTFMAGSSFIAVIAWSIVLMREPGKVLTTPTEE